MAAESLWQLEEVSLEPGRLRGLTVAIPAGVTAVLGWSGAGKTSLLNLLAGFERPTGGRMLGGPARVAWVPQNGGLWAHCTVGEHLALAARAAGGAGGGESLLAAFDLAGREGARPGELSAGEQARLSVARALAMEAPVLVMDEPLVHVDPARRGRYWAAIRAHLARTGASLVYSTHEPEAVLAEAGQVLCLRGGRVLHAGPAAALYWEPPTEELMGFLGPGNWLEPAEAQRWLGGGVPAAARCVRPEALAIEPMGPMEPGGGARVVAARFKGAVEEAELVASAGGEARTFFHRPRGPRLEPGMSVVLRLLALVCLMLAGCGRGEGVPELAPRELRSWPLPPDGASLPTPRSVATGNNDELAVLDTAGRVSVYSAQGALLRQWKMLDVSVGKPEGLVVLKDGRVVVCDTHYHRIVYFDGEGNWLRNFGEHGRGQGQFEYPVGICKDAAENLYICEYGGNDRIQKFTREGEFVCAFGGFGTEPGQFQRPSGLAWKDGTLYVADAINNRVLVFSDSGKYIGLLGAPSAPLSFQIPYDVSVAPDGCLYVIEYGAGRLSRISGEGRVLGRFGQTGAGAGQFATPWGITVDSAMRVHIADTKNRRVVTLRL